MLELIIQGKIMMIPLLACSVLALAVIFDRAKAFAENRKVDTRALRSRVLGLLGEGNLDDAALLCANTPGPVSAVLLAGLQSYAKHKPVNERPESLIAIMDKAMEDYTKHAISAVEKRLAVLSTIGNAAPLLGMTGTVTGMIASFGELAAAGGLEAGGKVAQGISEALITTAAGLMIALVAVIPYNIFTSMADKIDLEIEEATSELLEFVATRVETGTEARLARTPA